MIYNISMIYNMIILYPNISVIQNAIQYANDSAHLKYLEKTIRKFWPWQAVKQQQKSFWDFTIIKLD